jgi:hypothetical protein
MLGSTKPNMDKCQDPLLQNPDDHYDLSFHLLNFEFLQSHYVGRT